MADKLNFPFVEKEGKFFSPIVSMEPVYRITDLRDGQGELISNPTPSGSRVVGGVKGVYAQVRMILPTAVSGNKAELFAVNSEAVNSSN